MPLTVRIKDETIGGDSLRNWAMTVFEESMTVRELLRSRVYQEVDDHNTANAGIYFGLVAPEGAVTRGHGWVMKAERVIDWKAQFDRAVGAFENQQVLILLDDRQLESLDEKVRIGIGTTLTFIRLLPLVGG